MKVMFPSGLLLDTNDATNNGDQFTWVRGTTVLVYYPSQELGLVYEKDDTKIIPIIYKRKRNEQTKLL